jgi:hypothetical protein
MSRTNYLAVLACVVMHALLGMAWFGYWAEPWTKMIGHSMDEMKTSASMIPYVWSFAEALIFALFTGWLIRKTNSHTLMSGARRGLLVALCTVGIAAITNYEFAMRPMKLAFIDFGFPVLSLTLMGAVQGAWKTKRASLARLASI